MEQNPQTSKMLKWAGIIVLIAAAVFGVVMLESRSNQMAQDRDRNIVPTGELAEVNENDNIKGADEPLAVLIEYGDFQCPACGMFYEPVKLLAEEYSSSLQVVYRHFPLTQIHPNAEPTARATQAAARQGMFWEMHDTIFERQTQWSNARNIDDILMGYAQEIGLDQNQFAADYRSSETRREVLEQRDGGLTAGVSATPTFFLNGERITNPRNYEEFAALIEAAINNAREE